MRQLAVSARGCLLVPIWQYHRLLPSGLFLGERTRRLFAFQLSYEATTFLAEQILPDELIYIKASITDHLERIALSQFDNVVCWRERCGRRLSCRRCKNYRRPHAPPFGLAEMRPSIPAPSFEELA